MMHNQQNVKYLLIGLELKELRYTLLLN